MKKKTIRVVTEKKAAINETKQIKQRKMSARLIIFYAFMSLSFICATCGVIENNETSDSGR